MAAPCFGSSDPNTQTSKTYAHLHLRKIELNIPSKKSLFISIAWAHYTYGRYLFCKCLTCDEINPNTVKEKVWSLLDRIALAALSSFCCQHADGLDYRQNQIWNIVLL